MVSVGVVSYRCMSSIRYCQASSIVSYGWVSSMIECGMSSSLLQYPVSNIKYYVSSITKHGIKYGRVAMIKSWASSTMVEYWISSIIRSCQASVPSIGECHLQRSTLSDGRVSACMVSYQIWTSLIQYQAWYHVDECQVSFTMVEYCLVSSMEYPTWSSVIEYGVLLMIVENRVSSIIEYRVSYSSIEYPVLNIEYCQILSSIKYQVSSIECDQVSASMECQVWTRLKHCRWSSIDACQVWSSTVKYDVWSSLIDSSLIPMMVKYCRVSSSIEYDMVSLWWLIWKKVKYQV